MSHNVTHIHFFLKEIAQKFVREEVKKIYKCGSQRRGEKICWNHIFFYRKMWTFHTSFDTSQWMDEESWKFNAVGELEKIVRLGHSWARDENF